MQLTHPLRGCKPLAQWSPGCNSGTRSLLEWTPETKEKLKKQIFWRNLILFPAVVHTRLRGSAICLQSLFFCISGDWISFLFIRCRLIFVLRKCEFFCELGHKLLPELLMIASQFHQPTCCFSSEAGNLSRWLPCLMMIVMTILSNDDFDDVDI